MSLHNSACPHCGKLVEPGDAVCSNCWCDLRVVAASSPATEPIPFDNEPFDMPRSLVEPPPQQQYSRTMPEEVVDMPFAAPPIGRPPSGQSTPRSERPTLPLPPKPIVEGDGFGAVERPVEKKPPRAKTAVSENVMLFRPRLRPPMAVLKVFDDDLKDGEQIRIRTPEFIIGRTEGDLRFPLERMMSAKHAKISCRYENEHYRWYLTDLGSSNGTFLRVRSAKLEHNHEVMLGSFRYRFNSNPQGRGGDASAAAPVAAAPGTDRTMMWKTVAPSNVAEGTASLIRVLPDGSTTEFKIHATDVIVGSDPGRATVRIMDDAMLSGAHVRIYCDEHRRWMIEELETANGLWLFVTEKLLDMGGQFQLGEQRFGIRFP